MDQIIELYYKFELPHHIVVVDEDKHLNHISIYNLYYIKIL